MAPLALQQVSCNAVLISGGRAVKASRRSSALDLFTIVRLAPEAPRCGAAVGACCINPPLIPRSAPSISHRDQAQHVVAGPAADRERRHHDYQVTGEAPSDVKSAELGSAQGPQANRGPTINLATY